MKNFSFFPVFLFIALLFGAFYLQPSSATEATISPGTHSYGSWRWCGFSNTSSRSFGSLVSSSGDYQITAFFRQWRGSNDQLELRLNSRLADIDDTFTSVEIAYGSKTLTLQRSSRAHYTAGSSFALWQWNVSSSSNIIDKSCMFGNFDVELLRPVIQRTCYLDYGPYWTDCAINSLGQNVQHQMLARFWSDDHTLVGDDNDCVPTPPTPEPMVQCALTCASMPPVCYQPQGSPQICIPNTCDVAPGQLKSNTTGHCHHIRDCDTAPCAMRTANKTGNIGCFHQG